MHVKICGLSNAETVAAAIDGGARYIGFVFFPKSPRCVTPEVAARLAVDVPAGVCKVALLVNPTDAELKRILDVVPIDMLQLHGEETPDRVKEVRETFGLPVMKAVGIADASDLDAIAAYASVSDQLLIDTKAPKTSDIPGGNGIPFDWGLLKGRRWAVPWMLAGGLTTDNVAEAAQVTGAQQIDLSSAVELERGVKDPALIKAFLDVAHA